MILMLFNLLSVVIAIGSIYFLPIKVSFLIGIILYCSLLFAEIRLKRLTPIVSLVLSIYIFLSIAYFVFDKEDWIPYTGSIFYFPLASISFLFLIAKRPFTIYFSGGRGMMSLHYVTSGMWAVIYLLAGIATIVLMPGVAFLYVPFLLLITGNLATIFLHFFYFGSSNKRERVFDIGKYHFKEIDNSIDSLDDFYSTASKAVWSEMVLSRQKAVKTLKELKETMVKSDIEYDGCIVRFVVYTDKKPIGTIFCVMDSPKGLPIERDTGISMGKLRKLGKVMEVGHFTIDTKYRFKPDIFLGLFKAAIDFAMEQNIDFLANCSYDHSAPMYEKIGFEKISDKPIPDTILGVDTCPSILNLSRLVLSSEDSPNISVRQLKPILSPFIMERYYKRQLILNIVKKIKPCDLQVENLFCSLKAAKEVC